MKLLLDENLPVRLKYRFSANYSVSTVTEQRWTSLKYSELLHVMIQHGFDVLITDDRSIAYQQNLENFNLLVLVLVAQNNRYTTLKQFVSIIEQRLPTLPQKGLFEIKIDI